MRHFTLFPILITLIGCIRGRYEENGSNKSHNSEDDASIACAPAPSGTGYWQDKGSDGLHCNYLQDDSDNWAYGLNYSETDCQVASWAPYQQDGGYVKMWTSSDGNRGCDWVIPW